MKVEIDRNEAHRANSPSLAAMIRGGEEALLHSVGHKVEVVAVSQLAPCEANARRHSRKQIQKIAESINRFGFCNPVLVDDADQIIAGHGRVEAAKLLGLKVVPALRLSHLSAVEKRAYIIADNRLAELAGWDSEILAIELQGLIDVNFEVELTGFDIGEVEIMLNNETAGSKDEISEPISRAIISQAGVLESISCSTATPRTVAPLPPSMRQSGAGRASRENRRCLPASARPLLKSRKSEPALRRRMIWASPLRRLPLCRR